MLLGDDLAALAWACSHLPSDSLRRAARNRGADARIRALVDNVLAAAWAKGQHQLDQPIVLGGLVVAGISDLLAAKVKVIGDRGELRDYVELMAIEQQTGRTVEEGIELYLQRYGVVDTHPSVRAIVLGLGHFDDVVGDPLLEAEQGPGLFDGVRRYWKRRQPEVIAHLDRRAQSPPRGESE